MFSAIKIIGIVAVLLFAKSVDEFVMNGMFEIHQLWIRIPLFIFIVDSHYAVVQYPLYLICLCVMTISMRIIPQRAKELFIEMKEERKEKRNEQTDEL
ncbi:MAG: hypothetical protein J1E36_02960 [Eubacterium sp.]|nr:hypothetical protein [Eubacterium sp.]